MEDQLDGIMYVGTHAGSNRNHVNGSIGEIRGHANALEQGHLSIEAPGVVTAPGVDYVTYNPITEEIVLWDAKYRSEGGSYPGAVSDAQLKRWTSQLENTIRNLPDGDLKRDALDAYEQGRIKPEIFRWPK